MKICMRMLTLMFLSVMLFSVTACQDSKNPSVLTSEETRESGMTETPGESTESKHLSYEDIVDRMLDTRWLSQTQRGEASGEFSSYDRSSRSNFGNYTDWNANLDHHGVIGQSEEGELVALIDGAGYLSRIWSAAPKNGHIKIYIDGEREPRIDMPFVQLFSGAVAPFDYSALSYRVAEGYNCYVPITFSNGCRVVLSGDWGDFYHIGYTTFSEGVTVESFPSVMTQQQKEALSRVNAFYRQKLGSNPLGEGQRVRDTITVTSVSPYRQELSGSGAITGFEVRLPDPILPQSEETVLLLKQLKLRIYYDGADIPSVEVPLGDFFGCSYGITDAKTLLYGVRDDMILYNYYYMPYADGAVVEILANDGYVADLTVEITTEAVAREAVGSLRFCARFNRGEYSDNPKRMPDYTFLEASGVGRLVGLNLHVYKHNNYRDPNAAPGDEWWGEGDEKFFVDGETFPSWFGTGTEDFFGYAWCSGEVFSRALHAQSYNCGGKLGLGNRVLSRLFVLDSVPFFQSFEGCLEKYYGDDYASYAFTTYFYLDSDGSVRQDAYDYDDYCGYFDRDPAYVINEAELLPVIHADGAKPMQQVMTAFGKNWSQDVQVFWTNDRIGQSLELALPSISDGEYVLLASFTTASNYGIYSVTANGSVLNAWIDLYGKSVAADYLTELGRVSLTKGNDNRIAFTCIGKNESSGGYFFGLDFVMVIPVADYTGFDGLNISSYLRGMDSIVRLNAVSDRFRITAGEQSVAVGSFYTPLGGSLSAQNMGYHANSYLHDYQLWWTGTSVGSELTATIVATEGGVFDGTLALTVAADFGTVELYVNGQRVGSYDCYYGAVERRVFTLSGISLQEGSNTFLFRISGKNPASSGYLFGFDLLELQKR